MPLGSLTRRPLARLIAAAGVAVLLLAACVTPGDDGADSGDSAPAASDAGGGEDGGPPLAELGTSAAEDLGTDPASDPAYADYYEQSIEWGPCEDVEEGSDLECGSVSVPLVWDDPEAGDIEIAVARQAATGDRIGSLLLNPGGPGGSGVDFTTSATAMLPQEVQEAYDLVGFDPRGVSRSAGIECLSDAETDEMRASTVDATTAAGREESAEWMDRIAEACEANSGEVLPYLDTYSAARDMDVLRSAVDSEQLDYLGYSYGTYLGATYAELYPERVGRFVLDAAMDPALTGDEISTGQVAAFESAADGFLERCLDVGEACPFKGDVDEAKQQLISFLDSVDEEPLDSGDPERPLTGALARSAVMMLMYQDELWDLGRIAINDAAAGDGSQMLAIADMSAERNADGTYNGNGTYAITAINCLDHPGVTDEQWLLDESQRLAEEYPLFGPSLGYAGSSCEQWPEPPLREPAPITAEGADTIVVIGTTGDPATPYEWSQNLAEQLDDSVLLTYEGHGHTAYGRSGGCIEAAVDAYLLEDTVPEDGLTCAA